VDTHLYQFNGNPLGGSLIETWGPTPSIHYVLILYLKRRKLNNAEYYVAQTFVIVVAHAKRNKQLFDTIGLPTFLVHLSFSDTILGPDNKRQG
jgi:hypothetical protein